MFFSQYISPCTIFSEISQHRRFLNMFLHNNQQAWYIYSFLIGLNNYFHLKTNQINFINYILNLCLFLIYSIERKFLAYSWYFLILKLVTIWRLHKKNQNTSVFIIFFIFNGIAIEKSKVWYLNVCNNIYIYNNNLYLFIHIQQQLY